MVWVLGFFLFFKERLICIKNLTKTLKTFLKKFFTLGLHHHCRLELITLSLLLTLSDFHVCLCFVPALRKRKKTPDTPGSISLPETKGAYLLGVKLYLGHSTQMKMHSEEFCSISFYSLLSNPFFSLSSRSAAPMGSTIEKVSVVKS